MKRFISILLVLILVLSLAACGAIKPSPQPEGTADAADPTPTPKPTAAPADAPEPDEPEPAVPVRFDLEKKEGKNATERGILRAYDKNDEVLWEYETDYIGLTELDGIQPIGLISTGYLILVGGDVICLAVEGDDAGTEIWRNTEFGGASANFDLDPYDNLYICGYYGPDLMVIDPDGNTIEKFDYLTDEYWPAELFYVDGCVDITYESSGMTYRIDPRSGASMEIGPSPATWFYGNVVEVSTVDEFMNAIADDTAIVLAPGEYNLTAWLDKNIGKLDAMPYDGAYPEQGLYFEDVGDGLQLDIAGYDNLCIFSKYSANPARIVCEPRHAVVLDFFNCAYVYLQGLVIGHTPEPGSCTGDVVGAVNCGTVMIEKCELFGCGAYAVNAANTNDVMVNNCVVHGCKYGCAVLSNTYADFASTEFRDCELYTMFELYSSKAYFYACSFERLEGTLLSTDINSEAYFYDCLFDADAYQSLMTGTNQYGMVSVY